MSDNKIVRGIYPVNETIAQRWSPRSFSPQPVPNEHLMSLFEAARLAPSSFNEQPWRFIYVTSASPVRHAELISCLSSSNQVWAVNAPLLIVALAKKHFTINGNVNRHALHDVGLAVGNLSIQATHLGLGVHQMGGFSAERLMRLFPIPDEYEAVSVIAVGYRDTADKLPDELRHKETASRQRHPLERLVFENQWENTGGEK